MIRNAIDFGKVVSGLMSLLLVAGFLFTNSFEPHVLFDTFPDDEHVIEQTDTTIDRSSLRHPEKVDSVLSMMNLEEKMGQLNMLSSGFAETGPTLSEEYLKLFGEFKLGAILNAHTVNHTLDLQREAVEEARMGIPLLFAFDVIHGHRTIFPSWPYNVRQLPNVYYHKKTGRPIDPAQRYTSKYIDVPNDPLFPFGYGLSYTTFDYDNLNLSKNQITNQDNLHETVDITNTGDHAGHEVVQLYTRKMVASVTQHVRLLRDFEKVFLEPGETKTVEFTLNANQLTYLDQNLESTFEPGTVKVFVGRDVADTIESKFEIMP